MTITFTLSSKTVGEEFAEARERHRVRKALARARLVAKVHGDPSTDWLIKERKRAREYDRARKGSKVKP